MSTDQELAAGQLRGRMKAYLSEAALPDHLQDFVSVSDVVVRDLDVGAVFIVVTTVVGSAQNPRFLLCIWSNKKH